MTLVNIFRASRKLAGWRTWGSAWLVVLLPLSGGVHSANSQSLDVSCAITAINLDFPAINPMALGRQHGYGSVVIGCSNLSASDRFVNLSVLDTVAATHALKRRVNDTAAVLLDMYVDSERRHLLSALASSPHVLRDQLYLGPGAKGRAEIRFFPAVQLQGAVAAGDYGKQATMTLLYQAYSVAESAPAAATD